MDLHVLGSLESKKHKISMVSGCSLVIVQIFDSRFLTDLHVLKSGESKKHKISMLSKYSETKLGANDNKEKQRFERQ